MRKGGTQWVVDIVLDGTGSVALLGPFRSEQQAIEMLAKVRRALHRAGVEGRYMPAISDVYDPAEWRDFIDLTIEEEENAS